MKKAKLILAILGIAAVAAIVIVALVMANKSTQQDSFSVTGSGTVYAKADIANIEIGIKTGIKKTAAEATVESTNKMNQIITQLKDLGIKEDDIQTSNYALNPVYNWTEQKGQELTGYEVSQTVTIKIRDLSKIGDVISKTTEQGANQIGNISFTIDDEYTLKNQARGLAIEKAKEKAQLIAKQSGIKLGKIKNFYENAEPVVSPIAYTNAKMVVGSAVNESADLASPEIQSGQNEIKVDVTLVYQIK
jgi:uncharacterized protein YggE